MTVSSWPEFDSDQIKSVVDVLSSGRVNSWTGDQTSNLSVNLLTGLPPVMPSHLPMAH